MIASSEFFFVDVMKYFCNKVGNFSEVVSVFQCQMKRLRQRNEACSQNLLKKQIRLSVWHEVVAALS
jgi:hypothetical protein